MIDTFDTFQDYHWWWRSFIVSGGSAFYILIYSLFYFLTKLEITEFIPTLLYIGYTALMVITFWLLTGTIGFFAAYAFIRKIYSAVKIDWTAQFKIFPIVTRCTNPNNCECNSVLNKLDVESYLGLWNTENFF